MLNQVYVAPLTLHPFPLIFAFFFAETELDIYKHDPIYSFDITIPI